MRGNLNARRAKTSGCSRRMSAHAGIGHGQEVIGERVFLAQAALVLDHKVRQLDLCLLLDCTSSMSSWIERSKNTLKQIIDHVKSENPGLTVRVSFVGYRDIKDHKRFEISPFTGDIDATKAFIGKISASGGADMPEDVQGGFNKALI